jgi:hypothetical protein
MLTKLGVSEFDARYVHCEDLRLSLELMNAIDKFFRVGLLVGEDVSHHRLPEISLLCRDLIGLGCRQLDIAGSFSSAIEDTADRIFVEKSSYAIVGSASEITTTSVPTVNECLLMSTYNRLGDFYLSADQGLIVISIGESSYTEDTLVSMLRRTNDYGRHPPDRGL